MLEALSAGLPVIAPDVGGIREAVLTRETGILIESMGRDEEIVDAYIAAIRLLYADPHEFLRLRRGALDFVSKRHSSAIFFERVADILQLGASAAGSSGMVSAR